MNNYRRLFQNRDFSALWLGQFVSSLGDRFTQMSLLTIVMVLSQDSGEKMAWVTFYSLLPFLLFGQLFGALSDRLSRKKIMIAADILRAGLVASIPFVNRYTGSLFFLNAIIFCVGTLSALFSPAKMAIIPTLVEKERLLGANSLVASCGMAATLLGTFIAGFIIKVLGPYPSFYLNALTYLISALMIVGIQRGSTRVSGQPQVSRKIFDDIKEGLGFINRHQLVLRIVQLSAVFSFCSSVFYITILNYSTTVLGLSSAGYGILLACLGLGLCSGALLLGKRIGRLNYNRILMLGFFLVACMNFFFLLQPDFFTSIVFLVIGGAGASLVMVTLDSLLQRSAPDSRRASVFAARGIVGNGLFLASLVMVAQLLKWFPASLLFYIVGLASLCTTVLIYLGSGPFGYRLMKGFLRLFFRIWFDLKVKGGEHLPSHGRVILAGNHTSLLDGLVVMAAYPHQVYFLVADSVFKVKFVGFLARQFGFIPIRRQGLNKEAIREAIRILESRHSIGIFPEGRISPHGQLLEGKKGVAVIAKKTNTPVIPFAIEGARYAWPLSQKYPRRHPLEISFGAPLDVREYAMTDELARDVMEEIKKIKDQAEWEGLLEVDPNIIVRHLLHFS